MHTTDILLDPPIYNLTILMSPSNQCDAAVLPFPCARNIEPGKRFDLSADGAYVTDHKLGLIWAQSESEKFYDYDDAETYAKGCRIGGWDDWRLPDEQELQSLRDLTRCNPCIDIAVFKSRGGQVWTSTPYMRDPTSDVFTVEFDYGVIRNWDRGFGCFVRPVRGLRQ